MTIENLTETKPAPNWRHVGAFLGLTFGLTYLLNLIVYLRGGLNTPGIVAILQLQMLLPAFSAIVLGMFFFPESPIYRSRAAGRGRWFYYYFILLTVIYALGSVGVMLAPSQQFIAVMASIPLLLALVGLIILIVLRFVAGREGMAQVGLSWGSFRYYLLFGLGFVIYYILQAVLNGYFGLGSSKLSPIPLPQGMSSDQLLDPGRGAVRAVGADPGGGDRLWGGIWLARLPAKRAVQAGTGARRTPVGRDLGSLALAAHPDGL